VQRQLYSATSNNIKLVHCPLMDGLLHLVQRGKDWAGPQPARPVLVVPNATVHPSMASVPITVLMYNGPLLCGCNLPGKGSMNGKLIQFQRAHAVTTFTERRLCLKMHDSKVKQVALLSRRGRAMLRVCQ